MASAESEDLNYKTVEEWGETVVEMNKEGAVYEYGTIVGKGSFGVVCKARMRNCNKQLAIKRVFQDPRYKNRELDIMKSIGHPNIISFHDYFFTSKLHNNNVVADELYLNVVMDYVPDNVYKILRHFTKKKIPVPSLLVKLYMFQLCRAVGYLHALDICHRDIKPQNLLVDTQNHSLKLCDFGSAKRYTNSETSVSYICSRFYRAPELMLGATTYNNSIDTWSIGCVLGEMFLGRPLFPGETSVDQLVKIIEIMGTPRKHEIMAMKHGYEKVNLPIVDKVDLKSVFPPDVPTSAIELMNKFMKYVPDDRLKPLEALCHPFFDELRDPETRLPDGNKLPSNLFKFTGEEFMSMSEKARYNLCKNNQRRE